MARTAQAVIETQVKDGASAGFRKMQNEMDKTAKRGKVLNQQFRFMRGGLGQVGHQVQDVAVQLQMGQNAMLVFGQQGSQIASLFGPGGALLGAILAVGAALSMSLAPALFGATEAAKELKDANNGLIDNFDKLTPAQQKYARLLADKRLEEYRTELERLNKVSRDRLTIQQTGGFFDKFVAKKGDLESLKDYNERIAKLNADTDFYRAAIAALQSQVDGVTSTFEKQRDSLDEQIATFGLSAEQMKFYEIGMQQLRGEITETEAAELLARQNTLQALNDQKNATKELTDAQKEQMELAKFRADFEAMTEGEKTKHIAGEMSKQLMGVKGHSRKLFAIQKAAAVATAIVDTHAAAQKAAKAYEPPMSYVMAGLALINGMARVQTIRKQSFDGGGFTGSGARTGGVDGKGGFPAILHPNETVIDHTKGQGMATNVTINIQANDTRGFDELLRSRRGEIINIVNKAINNRGVSSLI